MASSSERACAASVWQFPSRQPHAALTCRELSELHLGYKPISFKEEAGVGKKQIPFDYVPLDKATEYAAEDADITARLWRS